MEYREDWFSVSRKHWEDDQEYIREVVAALEWEGSLDSLPFSQGIVIEEVIQKYKIPRVLDVAVYGHYAGFALYGIEAEFENATIRLYVLDRGVDAVPLFAQVWPKEPVEVWRN